MLGVLSLERGHQMPARTRASSPQLWSECKVPRKGVVVLLVPCGGIVHTLGDVYET